MSHYPVTPLLADMFAAFATPEAQAKGVAFDREMTALWAEALRETIGIVSELERQRLQLLDALADQHSGTAIGIRQGAQIIDLQAVINRRRPIQPDGGAA